RGDGDADQRCGTHHFFTGAAFCASALAAMLAAITRPNTGPQQAMRSPQAAFFQHACISEWSVRFRVILPRCAVQSLQRFLRAARSPEPSFSISLRQVSFISLSLAASAPLNLGSLFDRMSTIEVQNSALHSFCWGSASAQAVSISSSLITSDSAASEESGIATTSAAMNQGVFIFFLL